MSENSEDETLHVTGVTTINNRTVTPENVEAEARVYGDTYFFPNCLTPAPPSRRKSINEELSKCHHIFRVFQAERARSTTSPTRPPGKLPRLQNVRLTL